MAGHLGLHGLEREGVSDERPVFDFDYGAFFRQLDKAREIANDRRTTARRVVVEAKVSTQAGAEILIASCPKCNEPAALDGEGRHLCRRCFTWLEYRRNG